MTVEHVVLLKAVDGRDVQDIMSIAPRWRELIMGIPGVESAQIGPLISLDSKGYTHMVHIRFSSQEALTVFGPHPNHVATRELLAGKVTDLLIADLHHQI